MLTTHKMPTGRGLWGYLSGGADPDPNESLAFDSGYYTRITGEAWGRGAARLGLQTMTQHQFTSLAAGLSLDRHERLVQTQNGKHSPGVDIQTSPPKSVSIELITAGEEQRQAILAAHQRATRAAFAVIEDNALAVRVPHKDGVRSAGTQGGATWRVPGELVAYTATHWTSRASAETERRCSPPDPQLHTHVFVMNLAYAEDRFRCVDHREILRTQQYAEAVYQTSLAAELKDIGYDLDFTTDRRGRRTFELAGSKPETRAFFSTRHSEVKDRVREFEIAAGRPPTPWEQAELARVGRKDKGDHHGAEPAWRDYQRSLEAAGLELPRHHRHRAGAPQASLAEREAELTEELLGPAGLHREDACFYRRDVAPAVYRASVGRLSPTEAADYLDRLERSGELVTQRSHNSDRAQDLFTTRTQLAREHTIEQTVTARARAVVAAPKPETLARALAESKVALDGEQIAAAHHLAQPVGWAALEGYAGTGKTTTIAPVVAAYRADGAAEHVYAVSTAAETALRTADKIGADGGHTVESLRRAVDQGHLRLGPDTLVVVDEVAMMDTQRAAHLVELTKGCTVRTVGDSAQLQAIGAAGWYSDCDRLIGHATLTHVHRQRDDADRQACLQVRNGLAEQALGSLAQRGRFAVEMSQAEATAHLLSDYRARRDQGLTPREIVVVTDTSNQQIDQLNRLIQDDRVSRGELAGAGAVAHDTANDRVETFYAGDRVTFTKSWYDPNQRPGVKNGTGAEVTWIDHDRRVMGLRLDNGRTVQVAVAEYEPEQTLRLAYAGHATRIQGGEGRVALYLPGNRTTDMHSAYSALTRGTDEIRVYASHEVHGLDPTATLAARWAPGPDKHTALSRMVEDHRAEAELDPETEPDGSTLNPADYWEPKPEPKPQTRRNRFLPEPGRETRNRFAQPTAERETRNRFAGPDHGAGIDRGLYRW